MGSDDLFHKRKAKAAKELQRLEATKKTYDRVLIVCEGEKTEPIYFQALIDDYELSTANVKVEPSPSTCPLKLVQYAIECNQDGEYDKVYCVFDKDRHTYYPNALRELAAHSNVVIAANSVPCFEYWIFLHFEYTTAPFYGHAKKSPGEEAVARLKNYIPDYTKGKGNVYETVKDYQKQAIKFANRANKAANAANTDNPMTNVVDLVVYLEELRDIADAE